MIQIFLSRNNLQGYTLVEMLVSLGLFLAIIVPLMGYMSVPVKINRGKDKMIAAGILEQEAAILRMFPGELFTEKRRKIGPKEWVVKASFAGDRLKTCTLQVYCKGKLVDKAILYIHENK